MYLILAGEEMYFSLRESVSDFSWRSGYLEETLERGHFGIHRTWQKVPRDRGGMHENLVAMVLEIH